MHFSPALDETFGNAILGRATKTPDEKILKCGSSELRTVSRIFLDTGSNWSLGVINLHLDEKDENIRIYQIEMLLQWLDENESHSSLPHILCGDFNALSYWTKEYESKRLENGLQVTF